MLLQEMNFPIEGPERELLLILEWLIVLVFYQAAIIIYLGIRKKPKKEYNKQDIAYIILFMGYSILWGFTIICDFYCETIDERTGIYSIGILIIVFFGILFFYWMEKARVMSRNYIFTKIALVLSGIIVALFIIDRGMMMMIAFAFAGLSLFFFFLIYLIKLRRNIYIRNVLKNFGIKSFIMIIGVVSIGVGFLLTRNDAISRFGLWIRIIGDVLQLFGIAFVFIFLRSVPTLEEYEWMGKIDRLFLMRKSGICVYYKFFREESESIDKQLVSMATQSINLMLEEFTEKKGISIIEKKSKNFIIQPGDFFTAVLICDTPLNSLKYLLNRFMDKLQMIYYKVLEKSDLKQEIFQPIESIAKEIFLF